MIAREPKCIFPTRDDAVDTTITQYGAELIVFIAFSSGFAVLVAVNNQKNNENNATGFEIFIAMAYYDGYVERCAFLY